MTEKTPEVPLCDIECCLDEYATQVKYKETKATEGADQQIYELDEPIRVFLFDIPKAEYAKKARISALYSMCIVFLGFICIPCLIFPFQHYYKNFSRNIHVPFSTIGTMYHATPGMMAMCKFFDSSHVLNWADRRLEHAIHMLLAFLFLMGGLALYTFISEPEFDTFHARFGLVACLADLVAFVSGLVTCTFSKAGPQGVRAIEPLGAYAHAYIGIATYATFVITFATGLKGKLKLWLNRMLAEFSCHIFILLIIFIFIISLTGPYLRFRANRDKAKFQSLVKKRKKWERKRKERLEKLGLSPEGLMY